MEAGGTILVRYSGNKVFTFFNLGDLHFGNRACDKELFKKHIIEIYKNPNGILITLGDMMDLIALGDKRQNFETIDPDIVRLEDMYKYGSKTIDELLHIMFKVKNKCVAATGGNHDEKYRLQNQQDVHATYCEFMECINLRYCGIFQICFERVKSGQTQIIKRPLDKDVCKSSQVTLRVFATHGFGAAATPGGKTNALIKASELVASPDLVLMGHLHASNVLTSIKLDTDKYCKNLKEKTCQAVICGSYLRGYMHGMTGYEEFRGYRPNPLGMMRTRFNPLNMELMTENKTIVSR